MYHSTLKSFTDSEREVFKREVSARERGYFGLLPCVVSRVGDMRKRRSLTLAPWRFVATQTFLNFVIVFV